MRNHMVYINSISTACALIVAAAVLLTGCATVGPNYAPPAVSMPETWSGSTPQEASRIADPAKLAEWWTTLDDPVLTRLIERAIQNNLDLKKALARLEEYRARRGAARADLTPTVSVSGAGSSSRSSEASGSGQTHESYSLGVDASWELDLFGSARRSVEAAQADYEATREDLHDVLTSLVAETATAYVQLRTDQKRLAAAEENLRIQTDTLQLTAWRYESGLAGALDMESATYNLESTRSQIPALQAQAEEMKNRLAVLLGEWPGSLTDELSPTAPIPTAALQMAVGIPADLLRRRPDIRRAERELAAQTARVGAAEADLYPKLTLQGSLGFEALAVTSLINPANLASSLGAGVLWTAFKGGALRQTVKVQSALQEQALIAYESAVLSALEDVENALVNLAKENERRESLAKAVESAKTSVELSLHEYESGLVDFQTVLNAQKSLTSFQDNLAASDGAMTVDLISLYKALGGGWADAAHAPADNAPPK